MLNGQARILVISVYTLAFWSFGAKAGMTGWWDVGSKCKKLDGEDDNDDEAYDADENVIPKSAGRATSKPVHPAS